MIEVREEVKENFNNTVEKANANPVVKFLKKHACTIGAGIVLTVPTVIGYNQGAQRGSEQLIEWPTEYATKLQEAHNHAARNRHEPRYFDQANDLSRSLEDQLRQRNRSREARRGAIRGAGLGVLIVGLGYGAKKVFKLKSSNTEQQAT